MGHHPGRQVERGLLPHGRRRALVEVDPHHRPCPVGIVNEGHHGAALDADLVKGGALDLQSRETAVRGHRRKPTAALVQPCADHDAVVGDTERRTVENRLRPSELEVYPNQHPCRPTRVQHGQVGPPTLVGQEEQGAVGSPPRLGHGHARTPGDPSRRGQNALRVQGARPQLGGVPRHVGVVPLQPCQRAAIGT